MPRYSKGCQELGLLTLAASAPLFGVALPAFVNTFTHGLVALK